MTENTETTGNTIPGIEVTQTPGLIPEVTEGRPDLGPDTTVPPTTPETLVPPTTTGTEWDGTIAPPPYTAGQPDITEVPPTDYAAAVDHQVDSMPSAPPDTHDELMKDPAFAVHVHEQQLNKFAELLEELCVRVISVEKKLLDMEEAQMGIDTNNPIADYPEVQMHQNK